MIDLQRYRKENKLDQKHIAAITGLDQALISKYENGKHVTQHVTDTLLKAIPDLKSYMIDEKSYVNDPVEPYQVDDQKQNLIKSLLNLTESNRVLAESVNEAIKLNAILIAKISVEMV